MAELPATQTSMISDEVTRPPISKLISRIELLYESDAGPPRRHITIL